MWGKYNKKRKWELYKPMIENQELIFVYFDYEINKRGIKNGTFRQIW